MRFQVPVVLSLAAVVCMPGVWADEPEDPTDEPPADVASEPSAQPPTMPAETDGGDLPQEAADSSRRASTNPAAEDSSSFNESPDSTPPSSPDNDPAETAPIAASNDETSNQDESDSAPPSPAPPPSSNEPATSDPPAPTSSSPPDPTPDALPPLNPPQIPSPESQSVEVPGSVPDLLPAVQQLLDPEPAPMEASDPEPAAPNHFASAPVAAPSAPPVNLPASLAVLATSTLIVGATASALAAPGGRRTLWQLLRRFVPLFLFSRISDDEVLSHPRRNEIYEYVRQNPGERIEVARRALRFPNGAMLHHLHVLDAHNLVRLHREGVMTRLYPAGPRIQPAPYLPPLRRRLLEHLRLFPGATQREIAAMFGVSERVVSYHVGWLSGQGLVNVERRGPTKRCFPAATPLVAPPVLA